MQETHPNIIHLYITKDESLEELKKLLRDKGISIDIVKIAHPYIILADPQNTRKISH